ncbi:Uncharacterised protein [Serratia plymuthica]|nr:Uncharacterised protein [Serratia plymuthica]VEI20298.1 Uncharacterised protein [Serratia plymuthica]
MAYYINKKYQVIGMGNKPYEVTIQILQDTWDKCDLDVQTGVNNILASEPIPLLSSSGKGNGIKQETKGLEFHTQTQKRLQFPGGNIRTDTTFIFDSYGKGWGH